MNQSSRNYANRVHNTQLADAAFQAYITLLRMPIPLRLKYQDVLVKLRDNLARTVKTSNENMQNKAEEIAVSMGGLI